MIPEKQSIARIRKIFAEAQDIPEGAERDAFIAEACRGSPELEQEILSLLGAYDTTCDFLTHDASGATFIETPDLTGTQIDHYKLIELIGEGGFGEVYRAEQTEPFEREVALKIIKLGMDTKGVVARFKAERQALARMNHPNIAQVYDAGSTESGRPYFVMELVHGVPILEYCDGHRLPLPDRIALFQQVCDGVQHAHKKGILHRDLKPSNILVSEENGRPIPKIIDFGIAKSLEKRLTSQQLVKLREMLLGTPLYMSPEQLEQNNDKIDARSDIYSLGVILYELVTGATPLAHKTPTALTISDMRQALLDKDLPRPSKRFQSLGRRTTVIARRRGIKPPMLERQLKGDLDWIVMKAIEKEPEHRYEDSLAFSDDLTRFLGSRPVTAGRPRLARRIKKFFRRHKTTRYVIGSVTLTIFIGAGMLYIMREPAAFIDQRGWKLEKFYDMGNLRANGFAIRPDGSVLIVNEWGSEPKGLYWAKKGGTWSPADIFSSGSTYVDPEDAIELPEGIYVTVNTKYPYSGYILKVSPAGGTPEIFCDNPKIINPYRIILVPEQFRGRNVDPGDLLIFDNAHGNLKTTTIWSANRSSGRIRPLISGTPLNKCYISGGFAPDGMLYVGLNTYKSDEVSILKISPDGDTEIVFKNFYAKGEGKIGEHPKAVHPVTGEMFFSAGHEIYAFYPGYSAPHHVLSKRAAAMRWTPDGSTLYFIADGAVWTLSGPGIETEPVSYAPAPNPPGKD